MNCRTFQRRFQSLLDERRLPEDDVDLVEHTWDCESCHQLLVGQQQLWTLLASDAPPAPPAKFADGIIAHVNYPLSGLTRSDRSFTPWLWLVVAASLLIMLAPLAMQIGRHPGADPVVIAQRHSPETSKDSTIQQPVSPLSAEEQKELDRIFGVLNRLREQELDRSVDEITSPLQPTIRPITASFNVTLDALRRTLPIPSKHVLPKPQADARYPDIFA